MGVAVSALLLLFGQFLWRSAPSRHESGKQGSDTPGEPAPPNAEHLAQAHRFRIVTADGRPPVRADFIYRLLPEPGSLESASVAAEGTCVVPVSRGAERLLINVSAEGSAKAAFMFSLPITSEAGGEPIELRLRHLARTSVRVIDRATRLPIDGATVQLQLVDKRPGEGTVLQVPPRLQTGPAGAVVTELCTGEYATECEAEGYRTLSTRVEVAYPRSDLVLELEGRPPLMRGRVLEASTLLPIGNAMVTVLAPQWSTETTDTGEFCMPDSGLPSPSPWADVRVDPPGTRPDLMTLHTRQAWRWDDVTLLLHSRTRRLRLAADVPSQVLGSDLAWAAMATGWPPADTKWLPIAPDPDGLFTLPPDVNFDSDAWLRLRSDSGAPVTQYAQLPDLEAERTERGLVLVWSIRGRSEITVSVREPNGKPVPAAGVEALYSPWGIENLRNASAVLDYDPTQHLPLFSHSAGIHAAARTDAAGLATLEIARVPRLYLRCRADGYRSEVVRLEGEERLSITLQPCGFARGVIQGYDGRSGLQVVPADELVASDVPVPGTRSDVQKSGEFVLHGYSTGRYRLYLVGVDTWDPLGEISVTDAPGPPVVVDQPASRSKSVLVESDALVVGDTLNFRHLASGADKSTEVDSRGRARVFLRQGRYRVLRGASGGIGPRFVFADREVDVRDGVENRFSLSFTERPGRVRLMRDGRPASKQWVRLVGARSGRMPCMLVTDGEGWLDFACLPSDRFVLLSLDSDAGGFRDGRIQWRVTGSDLGGEVPAVR